MCYTVRNMVPNKNNNSEKTQCVYYIEVELNFFSRGITPPEGTSCSYAGVSNTQLTLRQ